MSTIILVATGHRENGLCNSNELYKIIEQVAPDVIFEEIPPTKFPKVYEGSLKDSLETFTVKKYLQKHSIAHYPVDSDTSIFDSAYKAKIDEIFAMFCRISPEYDGLVNQHRFSTIQYGFPYLNSDQCTALLERKHAIGLEIVKNINQADFNQAFSHWLNLIDSRENEMVKNIYRYSNLEKYEKALFLVGAEHRKPIMQKVQEFKKTSLVKLEWDYLK